MNDQRQPLIRYRTSIWLFSFLILVLFGVFSIGVVVNVSEWGNQWKRFELNHFITTSNSLELLLKGSPMSQAILENDTNPRTLDEIQRLLLPFRFNTSDRVYVINRDKARQLFPDFSDRDDLSIFSRSNRHWKSGWSGIRSLTAEYESWDGTPVVATIIPELFSEAGPGVLIVLERERQVFDWPEKRIAGFMMLSIFGLVFAYIVVLYYGRKMLQPFSRLETILRDAGSMKSNLVDMGSDFKDPVQRAIETFAGAIQKLQEQEDRLEFLGDRLAQPMSQMDAYEEELLASVNTGIITFDQNRLIQTMTSRVPRLLRIPEDDVRGKRCETVFGAESEICKVLIMALEEKGIVNQHIWRWHLSGKQPVWLSVSTTLIQSGKGETTGVGCVIRDVTLLKRLHSQIREKEHLAALGELSAGVAHEFRNPLGAIHGNAQYLAESSTDPELRSIAQEICAEVKGLDRIIRDFLNFARPLQPQVSKIDIRALIQEELAAMARIVGPGIRLSMESDAPVSISEIDDSMFRQVIRNVISNACQAMESGGDVFVTIDAAVLQGGETQDPDHYIIRIRDTGPGIEPDLQDEVFKPFFTGRPEGTGLGLAIVKKIILMHNGFVEFERTDQPGAILRITLPIQFDPEKTGTFRKVGADDPE